MQSRHVPPRRGQYGLWLWFVAMVVAALCFHYRLVLVRFLSVGIFLVWPAVFLGCGVSGFCFGLDLKPKLLPASSAPHRRFAIAYLLAASILWLAVAHWFRPPDAMDLMAIFRPNPTYAEQWYDQVKRWTLEHRGLINGTLCCSWGLTGLLLGLLLARTQEPGASAPEAK